MSLPEKFHAPVTVAFWLMALPFVIWFFAGAGAGTIFNWLAGLMGTIFAIFGWVSVGVGVFMLLWTVWRMWREGHIALGRATET